MREFILPRLGSKKIDFCTFFLVFLSYVKKKQYLCSASTALLRSRVRKRYKNKNIYRYKRYDNKHFKLI